MRPPPFEVFFNAHRDDVYRFLVVSVGKDAADDCFQETFLAALRAYSGLRHASNLKAWVFTIAHRKAIDASRHARHRPLGGMAEAAHPPAIGSAIAEEAVERTEILDAIATLPPKQRSAVLFRYFGGMRHAEIAEVLRCSPEAARRSVHEGIKKLREVWIHA